MLLAGNAEVNVRVDESGQGQQALPVDGLGSLDLRGSSRLRQFGDLPVADDQVAARVEADPRIEEPGSANDQVRGLARTTDEVHAGCPIVGVSTGAGPRSG